VKTERGIYISHHKKCFLSDEEIGGILCQNSSGVVKRGLGRLPPGQGMAKITLFWGRRVTDREVATIPTKVSRDRIIRRSREGKN